MFGGEHCRLDETVVQRLLDSIAVHLHADEDDFLPPVAPDRIPMLENQLLEGAIVGPSVLGNGCPPAAHPADRLLAPGDRQFSEEVGAGGKPEMALRTDHIVELWAGQEAIKLGRVEGGTRTVDEAFDAIFLAFRTVAGKIVQFLQPERMLLRCLLIVKARIEDAVQRHAAMICGYNARVSVERGDDLFDHGELVFADIARLVDDDHIGKFDLLDQQAHEAAIIAVTGRLAAREQEIAA